jgi:transglutaminase/protease-like cytokinesis protein 3
MFRPIVMRESRWLMAGLTASLLAIGSVTSSRAQTPGESATHQHPSQSPPNAHMFASDAGMVLNFIKPDKTADFESVMQKLKDALQKSEKPERKQQAASWKVFRSPEAAQGGNALYVFVIDPAVKGADYTVSNILAEAYEPAELNELYKTYAGSYASGQNIVNLTLIAALGPATAPPDTTPH